MSLEDDKKWSLERTAARISTLRELSVTYEGYSEEVALRPPDISRRGMFINTSRDFPEGAILHVHFRLGQTGAAVNARAEVRYCLAGVGVGIEFVEIPGEALAAIDREIGLQKRQPREDQRRPAKPQN
jgi:PilZ domain